MAIECTQTIDVNALLKPLMLKAAFSSDQQGGLNLDAIINIMVEEKIEQSLLQNVELPQDFQDLADVICLTIQTDKLKRLTAILRGEQPQPGAGFDKIINMIVQLQMLSALEGAFGGGEETTTQ